MKPEIINGIVSILSAFFVFSGGIIAANINNKKTERTATINKQKEVIKQLAEEVIKYSKMESALIDELKGWTNDYKKDIRAQYYNQLFGNGTKSLMGEDRAQHILEEYTL